MPKCTGIATRLAGVWDAATKAGVEHAFAGKRSFAPKMFQATTAALDAYAAEWTAAATDNCEATRVRGEQAQDVMGRHPGLPRRSARRPHSGTGTSNVAATTRVVRALRDRGRDPTDEAMRRQESLSLITAA
jgi:hypothetical protein